MESKVKKVKKKNVYLYIFLIYKNVIRNQNIWFNKVYFYHWVTILLQYKIIFFMWIPI